MSRKTILSFTAALAGLTAGAALAQTPFLPGVYDTVTTYGDGAKDTSRHCAKAGQLHTLKSRLAAMAQDPSCKFSRRSVAGGRFAIAATCNNEGVRSS